MIVTAVLTITLWGMSPTDTVHVHVPHHDALITALRTPRGCTFDQVANELWCWATGEQLIVNASYTCPVGDAPPQGAPPVVAVIADAWWQLIELRCGGTPSPVTEPARRYMLWFPFIPFTVRK